MSKVQANVSFRASRLFVSAGTWWDADDPVVKRYPTLFRSVDDIPPVRTTATTPKAPTAPPQEVPAKPTTASPKATWVDYVVSLGYDRDRAAMATKSALMALADELEG